MQVRLWISWPLFRTFFAHPRGLLIIALPVQHQAERVCDRGIIALQVARAPGQFRGAIELPEALCIKERQVVHGAEGNRVLFSPGSLAAGGSHILRFNVQLDATLPNGTTAIANTATASAGT